ncbi:MAG TPA: RnfABCDGE type electron transport complex subunit D [Bacilli bacterium]|nr:RnfABCDGE type electron transport complex subunit D [Bacilli bacterium]
MTEQRRFLLGKEPFIRKADSPKYGTDVIMGDLMKALIPLILFGWIKNGLLPYINLANVSFWTMIKPLAFVFIGGFTCWLLEFIAYKYFFKEKKPLYKVKNSFAPIPGIILAMMLSVNTPIWVLIIGCFFATIVGKILFGGFGYNIFNPALVGYLFVGVAYYGVIIKNGGFANPMEVEIMAGVTPMANFASNPLASIDVLVGSYGSLGDFFLGTVPGSLAETSALLCIISFIFLVIRKVIRWQVPVIYVGTVFVLTYIIGAFNGYALDLRYALFSIFSGALMFGAVFMATEPVTTPRTPNGKVIFALGLGVLTVLFRYMSNMPEGVASAIMVMNLFTVIIDRIAAKARVENKKSKVALNYGIIALILIGISSYPIIAYANTVTFTPEDVVIAGVKQDFISKNFIYTTYVGNRKAIVTVDLEGNIIDVSNQKYNSTEYLNAYEQKIAVYEAKNYAKYPYLTDVTAVGDNTILTIIARRPSNYAKAVTFLVTFNKQGKLVEFSADPVALQSDKNTVYLPINGLYPEDILPADIIINQGNLANVEIIATATQTTVLFIGVAEFALNYISHLNFDANGMITNIIPLSNTAMFNFMISKLALGLFGEVR